MKPFKDAYPEAKVIGPVDLSAKLQEQQGWQLDASKHLELLQILHIVTFELITAIENSESQTTFGFEEEVCHGMPRKWGTFIHRVSTRSNIGT